MTLSRVALVRAGALNHGRLLAAEELEIAEGQGEDDVQADGHAIAERDWLTS
jgi:hypothetical protein